jgi:hypothetical protein
MRKPDKEKSKDKRLKNLRPPFEKGNKIPEKSFDKKLFESLCAIHCTEREICDILGFKSHETLNDKLRAEYDNRTFEEVYPEFQSRGKMSLRRLQWSSAEGGSENMQKWLGIHWLGQTDKKEINTKQDHTIEIKRTIIHRTAEEFRQEEKQPRPDDN